VLNGLPRGGGRKGRQWGWNLAESPNQLWGFISCTQNEEKELRVRRGASGQSQGTEFKTAATLRSKDDRLLLRKDHQRSFLGCLLGTNKLAIVRAGRSHSCFVVKRKEVAPRSTDDGDEGLGQQRGRVTKCQIQPTGGDMYHVRIAARPQYLVKKKKGTKPVW